MPPFCRANRFREFGDSLGGLKGSEAIKPFGRLEGLGGAEPALVEETS
jgi:hypothetical protein